MSAPLILALPSKGRLMQDSEALFARAGLPVEKKDARGYRGRIAGREDIELLFLSAGEIARELAGGNVHFGITGADLVQETVAGWDARIALLAGLGYGAADVVVAVPELWIDVVSMEDLDDVAAGFRARHGRRMRIATKYWNLTQRFFAAHGIALYRVVESLGATEGAPAAGTADIIVDITTTGATLAANHLKIFEDGLILKSEAKLAASRAAPWSAETERAAGDLLSRLAGAGVSIDSAQLPNVSLNNSTGAP